MMSNLGPALLTLIPMWLAFLVFDGLARKQAAMRICKIKRTNVTTPEELK